MSFVSLRKVPSRSRSRGRVLDFISSSRRGQGSALGNGKLRVARWSWNNFFWPSLSPWNILSGCLWCVLGYCKFVRVDGDLFVVLWLGRDLLALVVIDLVSVGLN